MKNKIYNQALLNSAMMIFLLSLCSCGGTDNNSPIDDPSLSPATSGESGSQTPAFVPPEDSVQPVDTSYEPRAVGGGGAMSGLSISPYNLLWFVGTDMGTLFRSYDGGRHWQPISHLQTVFDSNLASAAYIGFSADGNTVFHAPAGRNPVRSIDMGVNWSPISIPLQSGELIKYWFADNTDQNLIFCATSMGLLRSSDKGDSWTRVQGISGISVGSFIDYQANDRIIYHSNNQSIFKSNDGGLNFSVYYQPSGFSIRGFAGGRDVNGLTLAFIDNNGQSACSWAANAADSSAAAKSATMLSCGYVWIQKSGSLFVRNNQEAGDHIRMAENNSQIIYVTGGVNWVRQYGTKIWVSENAGNSWQLRLHQYNWDVVPYAPWPSDKLEYSAPGVEIGWDDGGYESFSVNPRDATIAGGTGYYFLHVSRDKGGHWEAPFTEFADTGARVKGKKWKSVGLEVTSVLKLKFHPEDSQLVYASVADMAGFISDDGGETFRLSKAAYNTNYDYAFDPNDKNVVYAASGALHDWPNDWHANAVVSAGGIYKSSDRGKTWVGLTPQNNASFNRQFLSVAYDYSRGIIYGGTQGGGIARSADKGAHWEYFNAGLPAGEKIIPQIEIDPQNGNAYALLSGDAPNFTNQAATGIYILDVQNNSQQWRLLRETVQHHPAIDSIYKLWWYPTAFAVDFTNPSRSVLWLVDYENHGNWLATGAWKSIDGGKNWNRMTQFTHPTTVTLDPDDSNRVYIGGGYEIDGSWGEGGAKYTTDGGLTWKKNMELPLAGNLYGVAIDPNNTDNIFYTFFGGGMLYGPKPK